MQRQQVIVVGWVFFGIVWLAQGILDADVIRVLLALGVFGLAGYWFYADSP